MPLIRQLDPHVADLIAAGEVVERPASVVKELVENAIDAGATSVTVEVQHGGMSLIRVTDNGCGIAPEEAPVAFLRHATSKLRGAEDLAAIGTLGFRGEALAAVAAVSRVTLLTRVPGAPLGTSLSLEGGVPAEPEEAGCPEGTTLVVRDLFFNTPARLKFVKRDVYEGAAVLTVVQRLALSHPEVSIRLLRDGREILATDGDGQLLSAMYHVMGRDIALGFTPVADTGAPISVTGFTSLPVCCRGSRGHQYFFVNGRYVKNRTMTAALEEAYQNQKMVGKFPGCVLHVGARLSTVDVNVHPTKTEVKFLSEKQLFDAVYHAVLSALSPQLPRPAAVLSPPLPRAEDTVNPHQTSLPLRNPVGHSAPAAPRVSGPAAPVPAAAPVQPAAPRPSPPPPVPEEPLPWRLLGEAFATYILVEQGDTVFLIDKHAAHERMHFDRLRAADYTPMSQQLLTPLSFAPTPEEGAALLRRSALLEALGFELEDFGGPLLVRRIPSDLTLEDAPAALCALAEALLSTGTADPAAVRDALLRTMACKAALKGGRKSAPEELQRVAEAVMDGGVRSCPHGRPTAITLTRAQLEKQFKRA
ncbi:MAG: DNA mismatch repair endonuclease MutL [Clostridiales bacterium]|nr:DNA mismatch repair endonuclease MutL [Clostridiales bacterium]